MNAHGQCVKNMKGALTTEVVERSLGPLQVPLQLA